MLIFLILLAVSLMGLGALLGRKYLAVRNLSNEESSFRLKGDAYAPFWSDFYILFVVPAARVHREKIRPAVYKEMEKLTRRFRIVVLRVECLLLRFSEYVRGKRTINQPGRGCNGHKYHYWEQLNNCKNGANKEEAGVTQRPE